MYLDVGSFDLGFGYEPIGTLAYDLGQLVAVSDLGLGEVEFHTRHCFGLLH